MKKNIKISTALFTILFVLQVVILRYLMNNMAITGVSIAMFVEVAALIWFGVCAVKLCSKELCCGKKRALVATAVLYAITLIFFYDVQMSLIMSGLSLMSESLVAGLVPSIIVFAVKVILLVGAVYFAVAPEKEIEVSIEFETAKTPDELSEPEAVEKITEEMDEKEV